MLFIIVLTHSFVTGSKQCRKPRSRALRAHFFKLSLKYPVINTCQGNAIFKILTFQTIPDKNATKSTAVCTPGSHC